MTDVGLFGEFKNISFAFRATSGGIASRSGRNPFCFNRGISWAVPPAKLAATGYTGYPGLGTSTTSPGSIKAKGTWPMPSFDPIKVTTSDLGSTVTLNRRLYQPATAVRNDNIPLEEGY